MDKIITKQQLDETLSKHKYVILYFTAPWCGPCRALKPQMEKLAESMTQIKVVSVDIDDAPLIAQDYGVRTIPKLIVYTDGVMEEVAGFSALTRKIEEIRSSALA